MSATPTLTANSFPVDTAPEAFAELDPASHLLGDPEALRVQMSERGYLFFPGLIDPEIVLTARHEILLKYAVIGEVDGGHPVDEAIAGDRAGLATANVRAFSESVRSGTSYRAVTDAPEILGLQSDLLDGEVHVFDMRWPRFVRPGEGCGFHCDGPYMNRATSLIFSCWIPLGRVHQHEGALILLENSHTSERLHAGYLRADADNDGLVWLDDDPEIVRRQYGTRWLTTDFEAGDVLCFGMNMLHGALDNRSPEGRCRLSSDSRYQLATEPADPRWNGPNFEGHGGSRVFYPGLGQWNNEDFQDEWKDVDADGRLRLRTQP